MHLCDSQNTYSSLYVSLTMHIVNGSTFICRALTLIVKDIFSEALMITYTKSPKFQVMLIQLLVKGQMVTSR